MKPHDYAANPARIPVYEHIQKGPLDLWLSACAAIFGLSPIEREEARKDYAVAAWFAEPITIINSQYHGMVTQHSRWHVEEAGNQIHVHRYAKGRASVETAGLPIECEPGAITLLDYSRPFTSLHTENDCHSFFVPHTAINYQPSDALHAPVYSPDSLIGQLLGAEMDHLMGLMKSGATSIDPEDIKRFLGCVEVAMTPQAASMSARALARESLKTAIKAHIEQDLASPKLDVTQILQNFGVSRASLYRMFDQEGGVRTYIGRRRLYRAVIELSATPHQRGKIHEVADRWGFTTDANFNRVVRREFGVAPGSLFRMPVTQVQDFAPLSQVHVLMNRAARPGRVQA
ncbi:MAG: helix-turn-helix domain-containing protein [Henriciella sp.]